MTKDNGCVGSYSVSGYTRGDGTEVSGYTRTCGAAHNSSNSSSSSTSSPQLDDVEKMKRRAELLYPQTSNKQNSNVKHQIKNVIAVDYIENPAAKWLGIRATGKEAAENLEMSKTSSYLNTDYAKEHVIFNNYKEVSSDLQTYFKDKITEQLGLDNVDSSLKEEILNSTKGIYIDAQTESSKSLSEILTSEPDFINLLTNLIKKMKNNISVEGSLRFKDKNFYNAIGHADIKNMHINRNGDIDLLITDVYDFNPNSPSDLIQVGRERQERGEITPYFMIYHVIIPKNRKI